MKMKLIVFVMFIGIAVVSGGCFADAMAYTATQCLNNTKDEGQCKDCCDCMDTDAAGRTSCRDACIAKNGNFSTNSDVITVTAPSTLGANGDYSAAIKAATAQECKQYCDGSSALSCGDRRFCRDACNKTYDSSQTTTSTGAATPPPPGNGNQPPNDPNQPKNDSNGNGISIEQAVSDEAQQNTFSFDGLAFLTGDLCGDSFLPPGKVADFSGFQYLRDTDPTNLGHNTDFVTIIAFNMLNIMSDSQISELVALAKTQISMINEYGYKRFPLMKAFRRLIEGDIPAGTTGLSKTAVMAYSAELYQIDGKISYGRAQALGSILRAFTTEQKAKLDALKAKNGVGNWDWDSSQNNPLESLKLDKDVNVAVMTYSSEMYSWYAGSVEADTYFCPERQGTYFGSFYMKDGPAMAAGPGFTISSTLTADMGSGFLKLLTTDQSALVTNLVNIQKDDLNAIVETRRAISTELRKFMVTASVDKEAVLTLAKKYGELDGAIIYYYATNFVGISKTLSSEQKSKLIALRESWNTIPCSGAYLYSEKINMPEIMNTDFLFGASTGSGAGTSSAYLNVGHLGNDLKIDIPCAQYHGNQFQFNLNYSPTPSDPLIWKMDINSFKQIQNSSAACLAVGDDLKFNLNAEYGGITYSFALDYMSNPKDPLAWKMDKATLKAK